MIENNKIKEKEKPKKRVIKYFDRELVEGTEEYDLFMNGDY